MLQSGKWWFLFALLVTVVAAVAYFNESVRTIVIALGLIAAVILLAWNWLTNL
ncbi:hypothetical protein [Prosthecomicrobium hirschii]|uniref:hypothetical protein n=1 Tax=Prosthecodimorpha hirschii TaxID=665126 RepID=UPI0015E28740|nr:hypothetical protein [Prosthecomicrobium hirschii]MCW1838782.1 hypothetical protein [Prosthecomicrobium hirschii]